MDLRPYQHDCVDAILSAFDAGTPSVFVELATGTGKTVIMTEVARRRPEWRTLVVCPLTTLISQTVDKFRKQCGVTPDIEQASLWANETDWGRNQFVVASKQTICKQRRDGRYRFERFRDVGLVIMDEAHLSITSDCKRMLDHFVSHGAHLLGLTATAKRLDKRSMANVYEQCVYQYGIIDAVPDGWLVRPMTTCVQIESLDLSECSKSGGDFNQGELCKSLEEEKTIYEIADVAWRESQQDGRVLKTAVYCASVAEARKVAERLQDHYHARADFVCADTKLCSPQRRADVLKAFVGGDIDMLCNVSVLTTGWDFPELEHIVMARPTLSESLYKQVLGRGTRPLPGVVDFANSTPETRLAAIAASAKPHFKMTDLVDNSLRHKLITAVDVMAGTCNLEVIEKVKDAAKQGGVDLLTAYKAAQQELEEQAERIRQKERERLARETAERQQRAKVRATTRYHAVEVDPFDGTLRAGSQLPRKMGPRMLFGKHKGQLVSDVPTGYLSWMLREAKLKDGWFKRAIQSELERRGKPAAPAPAHPVAMALDRINQMLLGIEE